MSIVRIPLHSRKYPGLFALVDEEDYPLVAPYRWHPHKTPHTVYVMRNVRKDGRRAKVQMHREILGVPHGVLVDHKDGDGLNNTRENIRPCTELENNRNTRVSSSAVSGYKGVVPRRGGKWEARIKVLDRRIHIGTYADKETAARAYDARAREYFGAFAHLNFPDAPPLVLPERPERRWFTADEDARILSLREKGMSWSQIGTAINRHPGSAHLRFGRLLKKRGAVT